MLRASDGTAVRRLQAGAVVIAVVDKSRKGNFHLLGPGGFKKKTGIRFMGRVIWTLKLAPGRYRYFSDGRPSVRRSFRVG